MNTEKRSRWLVPKSALLVAAFGLASSSGLVSAAQNESAHEALHHMLTLAPKADTKRAAKDAMPWMPSLEDRKRSYQRTETKLARLHEIDRGDLPSTDRLEYDRYEFALGQAAGEYSHRKYLIRPNTRNGIRFAARTAQRQPFDTVRDFESWIAHLQLFDRYMDRWMAILRIAVKEGITQPRQVIKRIVPQIEAQIVSEPEDSPFYSPFKKMPASFSAADKKRLRAAARKVISDEIVPAYEQYLGWFNAVYMPHARAQVGLSSVHGGGKMYAFLARFYTTTDLTAPQIHEIGLKKVSQLREQMERLMKQSGFKGTYGEYLEHLRNSPLMYYKDAESMLEGYRAAGKRVDPLLVKLFPRSLLPRIPYGIRPIAGSMAQDTFFAYAVPPAKDGTVAGYMAINLRKATKRARMDTQVLTCHEARPGHQLEIPIAMEASGWNRFRRYGRMTAFIEGWALYAETLCDDVGLYKTPNQRFAYLNYQMWRAVRLVIDTGIHTMGWSRDQAIAYFKNNSSLDMEHITNEVDRYITNPGQALAYMIGELEIEKLRARAEEVLGPAFDVRMFHCAVLRHGELPLSLLSRTVNQWIDEVKADPGATQTCRFPSRQTLAGAAGGHSRHGARRSSTYPTSSFSKDAMQ